MSIRVSGSSGEAGWGGSSFSDWTFYQLDSLEVVCLGLSTSSIQVFQSRFIFPLSVPIFLP